MIRRVLAAVGVLAVVAGVALAIVVGPDDRLHAGPLAVDHRGVAVVTTPGVVDWVGLELEVLARVPDERPILVGLANSVDLESYLASVRRLEVTRVTDLGEGALETRSLTGEEFLPGSPVAADWWTASDAGLGTARIATTLPDETVSLAVLAIGDATLDGLEVDLAWGVRGVFVRALGLAALGLGLVLWSRRHA